MPVYKTLLCSACLVGVCQAAALTLPPNIGDEGTLAEAAKVVRVIKDKNAVVLLLGDKKKVKVWTTVPTTEGIEAQTHYFFTKKGAESIKDSDSGEKKKHGALQLYRVTDEKKYGAKFFLEPIDKPTAKTPTTPTHPVNTRPRIPRY